jgi:hypothetical protein
VGENERGFKIEKEELKFVSKIVNITLPTVEESPIVKSDNGLE